TMAETVVLSAQPRTLRGTRHARRLRRKGVVPAVMYGRNEPTLWLALPRDEIYRAIRHGARLVDVQHGETVQKALIRDVQWDPLGHDILHVDFARVSADQRVEIEVRLELRGTAPGVAAGGVLNQPLHTLKVECPVVAIPEAIRVNISELQLDKVIHVRELVLPEGVRALNDPEAIVVQCVPKVVVEAAAAAPTPGEVAEPEVIGRQKAAEGEDEQEETKEKKK
ncbi:MAG: 50S ribosomal protein L25, partial [Gemmataceae bacterium]|nr:50S ribosomal protein L25 [Gemmataceae bacterium]